MGRKVQAVKDGWFVTAIVNSRSGVTVGEEGVLRAEVGGGTIDVSRHHEGRPFFFHEVVRRALFLLYPP